MGKKREYDAGSTDLNLEPFMNLVMVLIPGLLVQTEFVKFASVNVTLPASGGGGAGSADKPDKPPLNLTVTVTKRGFYVAASGGVLPNLEQNPGAGTGDPTIASNPDGSFDYVKLTELMQTIKAKRPDETKVTVVPAPDVIYDIVVHTLDATRSTPDQKQVLFPDVGIGQFVQ